MPNSDGAIVEITRETVFRRERIKVYPPKMPAGMADGGQRHAVLDEVADGADADDRHI